MLDYAWSRLDRSDLESRLTALCVHLRASRPFADALLLELLDRGPVGAGLLDNVLSGTGKRDASGSPDPPEGQVGTHSDA